MIATFHSAFAELGFRRVDDPKVPEAIRQAAKSVYRVFTPAGQFNRVVDMSNPADVNKAASDFAAPPSWQIWVTDIYAFQRSQLAVCAVYSNKFCTIFDGEAQGSAFVVNDGSDLYSALHVVASQVAKDVAAYKLKTVDDWKKTQQNHAIYFAMQDAQRNWISEGAIHLSFVTDYFQYINDPLSGGGLYFDMIRVHIDKFKGVPLTIATEQPKTGDPVYVVGYPAATTDRTALGYRDSDGNSETVSIGKIVDYSAYLASLSAEDRAGRTPETDPFSAFFFTDADCMHGNSGGVMLNAKGQVLGIVTGMSSEKGAAAPNVCIAVPADEAGIHDFWDQVNQALKMQPNK